MNSPGNGSEERFKEEWRRWLERPTRLAPSEAAERIALSLPAQRPQHNRLRSLAAAAALLLAMVALSVWMTRRSPAPQHFMSIEETAPIGDGEVLIWLDDETPLYMTFQAPETAPSKEGKS